MRTVTLIITAGIAAYKAIELVRLLRKNGDRVVPIMTKSAHEFVTPLTLEAIAEHPVYDTLFGAGQESSIGHIQLARQSDIVVVAPCSADFMAKYALGRADDLASTLLLANTAPVLLAPAMNHRMWQAAPTVRHLRDLMACGVEIVGPNEGEMACGEYGVGRMAEPEEIFAAIQKVFRIEQDLRGKKIVVTGGPTREAIDPVRYFSNYSSGKMAKAIVQQLVHAGAEVVFIHGPIENPHIAGARSVVVESARDMLAAVQQENSIDVFIAAAAVADWRVETQPNKTKKSDGAVPVLTLIENPDILAQVAHANPRPELVIGFAAETEYDEEALRAKLRRKGANWLLFNPINAENPAFDHTDNHLFFLSHEGDDVISVDWGKHSKRILAQRLVQEISAYFLSR